MKKTVQSVTLFFQGGGYTGPLMGLKDEILSRPVSGVHLNSIRP
jgi:hypothetical protein